MVVGSFGHDVQKCEVDMFIIKMILKLIIAVAQIPLTLLYFVLNFIGSILAGAGWIVGIIVFVITAVCWLFGQFNAWYQPVIGIMIAVGICFLPIVLTDFGSSVILKIKGLLHSAI